MSEVSETSCCSRLKRWSPALAGLALAGLGLGAAGIASSGVTITIAPPEAPSEEADPLALLRDEVATLQTDLSRLSEGLGNNLTTLATQLDGSAADRSAALELKLDQALRRLRALEALEREQLAELASLRSRASTAGSQVADAAEPPATEPAADEALEPEPEPEPAPASPKRGLFSFKLAGGLEFEERLRFEVIPSLSRVGFDAKSTLHDFSGVTSKVEGWLTARLGAADEDSHGVITAKAASLKTGVDGRDEEMLKILEVERQPDIAFTLASFETKSLDLEGKKLSGLARGSFRIHGVEHAVDVPVSMEVDRSRRLVLKGEARVKISEYGIEPPTVAGGAISMEDEIKLWLSLRLRSLGKVHQ